MTGTRAETILRSMLEQKYGAAAAELLLGEPSGGEEALPSLTVAAILMLAFEVRELGDTMLKSQRTAIVPARADCLREWKRALEWYAGPHRAEDFMNDNGLKAANALKFPAFSEEEQ
jgi:hypothetical protein